MALISASLVSHSGSQLRPGHFGEAESTSASFSHKVVGGYRPCLSSSMYIFHSLSALNYSSSPFFFTLQNRASVMANGKAEASCCPVSADTTMSRVFSIVHPPRNAQKYDSAVGLESLFGIIHCAQEMGGYFMYGPMQKVVEIIGEFYPYYHVSLHPYASKLPGPR